MKVITNPDREFADIGEFCDMPYHLIEMERYIKSYRFGDRCIDYETSRGCLARCFFCSEPLFCKHKWTALTPERTVSETREAAHRIRDRHVHDPGQWLLANTAHVGVKADYQSTEFTFGDIQ